MVLCVDLASLLKQSIQWRAYDLCMVLVIYNRYRGSICLTCERMAKDELVIRHKILWRCCLGDG